MRAGGRGSDRNPVLEIVCVRISRCPESPSVLIIAYHINVKKSPLIFKQNVHKKSAKVNKKKTGDI